MTTPEESTVTPPPPPAPMYYPSGPEPMLSVKPGGPIPRWVIVIGVAYGVVSVAFFALYVALMLSSWT
ncbi:hypothetical protein [Aeromicrobium sp. Sec7.5]|uniref:hypothetical protein n=1 Tax=Aeromicrobium sp. Sec7.5 TaxID=3121276 RepID=UPI002FE468B5